MNLNNIHNYYFLGIGGIGMSALARYFHSQGKFVCGYDKTNTNLTKELIQEGIEIHFEDNIELISEHVKTKKENSVVIYTPAIPNNNKELIFFKENNFELHKRAAVLGFITKQYKTYAVAGTHGKTTTSSLLAHIFQTAGEQPTAFLGGITKNYNTNLLLNKNSETIIVEADEYDRSFLTLHPEIAVITSVDADHLDVYGNKKYVEESYELFAQQVRNRIILKDTVASKIKTNITTLTYSLQNTESDYYATNIEIINGNYHFDLKTPNKIFKNLSLGLAGLHNVENAVAASAIATEKGVEEKHIADALKTFSGVKRRFDYQIKNDRIIYIDDYAHHPEELKATISSARKMFPNKKITGIFQPHLYSRTRDFSDEFAKSLDLLDECILLDIYPARELPIEGVSSEMLLHKMNIKNKSLIDKKRVVEELKNKELEILITMGAGDIDTLVEPIKIALSKK